MNPPTNRVRVVLLTQAIGPLDYRLPEGMEAKPGCVVMVPLGPRKLPGVIWDDDVFGDLVDNLFIAVNLEQNNLAQPERIGDQLRLPLVMLQPARLPGQ